MIIERSVKKKCLYGRFDLIGWLHFLFDVTIDEYEYNDGIFFFSFPAQVILYILILQLWVIDTYIICVIMIIIIIKISLWIFFFFYLSIYYEWKIVNGEMITRILVFLLPPSNRIKTNTVSLYDKSHLADQRSNYHSWYPNHVSILAQYKFQFVPINFSRFSLSFVFPLFTLLVIHSVKRNVESRS